MFLVRSFVAESYALIMLLSAVSSSDGTCSVPQLALFVSLIYLAGFTASCLPVLHCDWKMTCSSAGLSTAPSAGGERISSLAELYVDVPHSITAMSPLFLRIAANAIRPGVIAMSSEFFSAVSVQHLNVCF